MAGSFASATISCSSSNDYTKFMQYIKDKQTFVYFIGARDCPKCQTSKIKTWQPLTANNDQKLRDILTNDPNYAYTNRSLFPGDTKAAEAYKNMHLYSDEVNKVSGVFGDDSIKKIIDYIVKKTAEDSSILGKKIKNLTKEDLGITGVPLWLYFDQGQYEGFHMGEIDRPNGDTPAEPSKTTPSFMWLAVQHIVFHIWPKYHFGS